MKKCQSDYELSRRDFLKTTGVTTAALATAALVDTRSRSRFLARSENNRANTASTSNRRRRRHGQRPRKYERLWEKKPFSCRIATFSRSDTPAQNSEDQELWCSRTIGDPREQGYRCGGNRGRGSLHAPIAINAMIRQAHLPRKTNDTYARRSLRSVQDGKAHRSLSAGRLARLQRSEMAQGKGDYLRQSTRPTALGAGLLLSKQCERRVER